MPPADGSPTAQSSSCPLTVGLPPGIVTVLIPPVGVVDTSVVFAGSRPVGFTGLWVETPAGNDIVSRKQTSSPC